MSGKTKSTPLFMIHGFGVRSWFFDPLKKIFANRVVFTPDLYENSIEGRVQQVIDLIKKNTSKGEKVILIGHSLGGVISVIVSSRLKEKIVGLILIATPAEGMKLSKLSRSFQKIMVKKQLIPDKVAMSKFFSLITSMEVQKSFFDQVNVESDNLIDEIFEEKYPHSELLEKISVPTLCLGSKDDDIVNFTNLEKIAKSIQNSELCLVDKLNHSEIIHGPEIFTEKVFKIIKKFVNSHSK
ncbi:MAG: alpha/beta hydrolase [Candidatus Ranarchaeia archaeon]